MSNIFLLSGLIKLSILGFKHLLLLLLLLLFKKGRQCKAGREWLTPYQSEDPNPTVPTYRKKEEKGKNSRRHNGREQLGQ